MQLCAAPVWGEGLSTVGVEGFGWGWRYQPEQSRTRCKRARMGLSGAVARLKPGRPGQLWARHGWGGAGGCSSNQRPVGAVPAHAVQRVSGLASQPVTPPLRRAVASHPLATT